MPWFKVDDTLPHHRKVLEAGNAAMGLWVRAGALCAQQLTDGVVTRQMLRTVGTEAQARRLVDAGLWREHAEGYVFHEWSERQPSKEQVQDDRAKTAERQRKWREKRRNGNGATNTLRNGVTNAARGDGAPTRPDPSSPPPPSTDTAPQPPAGTPAGAGEKRDKQGSHTPARQLAATLLGLDPDHPKLDHLPDVLHTHDVRSPAAWLKTAAANGDLDNLLDQAERDANPYPNMPHNVPPLPDGVPMPEELRQKITRNRKAQP